MQLKEREKQKLNVGQSQTGPGASVPEEELQKANQLTTQRGMNYRRLISLQPKRDRERASKPAA